MTVTKSELANILADATGLTKSDVEAVVNGFLYYVVESIGNGDRVELRGFGSFYAKERDARTVKNPKTGQIVQLDRRFVPVFRPAKFFKEKANESRLTKNVDGSNEDAV